MTDQNNDLNNDQELDKNIIDNNKEIKDKNNNENKTEIEILQEELEKIKKQNEEHLNGWRRAKADYINLKKETEKKSIELIQYANASLIMQFLPIYENFKTAWNYIPSDDQQKDWVVGLGHIKKQMDDLLNNLGLEPVKTVGEKFNTEIHESVGSEKAEGKEDDVILKEVKGGFKLYGRVLEVAKVIVVKN